MKIQLNKYLRQLIALNEAGKAIEVAKQAISQRPELKEIQDALLIHSANNVRLQDDLRKETLSPAEAKRQYAQLNVALLALAEDLPKDLYVEVSAKEKRQLTFLQFLFKYGIWVLLTPWIIFALGLMALQVIPKKNVKTELILSSSSLSFNLLDENKLTINKGFEYVDLNSFEQIKIPTDSILLGDGFGQSQGIQVANRNLEIITPSGSDASVGFNQVSLQSLEFAQKTKVRLLLPLDSTDKSLGISMKPGNVLGKLAFSDSLVCEVNEVQLNNLIDSEKNTQVGFAELKAYLPPSQPNQLLTFRGKEDQFSINLELAGGKDFFLEEKNIFINGLDEKRENIAGKPPFSGVLAGSINFLNKKEKTYYSLPLKKGAFFDFKNYDHLTLKTLRISNQKIEIQAIGDIGAIYSGDDDNNQPLQNPSTLWWLLHHYSLILIFLVLLLSLATFAFSRKIKVLRKMN